MPRVAKRAKRTRSRSIRKPRAPRKLRFRGMGNYRKASRSRSRRPRKSSGWGGTLSRIGSTIASGALRYAGLGSYRRMQSNDQTSISMGQLPTVSNGRDRSFVFRMRDYLGQVNGNTPFAQTTFPLNPGQTATFPWLASIAASFEQWKPEGIFFEYVSSSGNAVSSSNAALGVVSMVCNYDASEPAFLDMQQILNYEGAISGVPTMNMTLPIECSPKQSPFAIHYMRPGAQIVGTDIRMNDWGNVTIATEGQQSAFELGRLYINYQIRCSKPIMTRSLNITTESDYIASAGGTAISTSAYLGTDWAANKYNTIGGTWNGASQYTFPTLVQAGAYLVSLYWLGGSTSVTAPTVTVTNGKKIAYVAPVAAGTSTKLIETFIVQITSAGCYFVLSAATLPTSPTVAIMFVSEFNTNVATNALVLA